jgi:hypothetical protein
MPTTDPPGTLTAEVIRYKVEEMNRCLPRGVADTDFDRTVSREVAGHMFLALRPGEIIEADLTIQIILLNAHAHACLRMGAEAKLDLQMARRFRAQAKSNFRLMRGLLSDLHVRQLGHAEAKGQWRQPVAAKPAPQAQPATLSAADARKRRAARIRELDLRIIEAPDTRH